MPTTSSLLHVSISWSLPCAYLCSFWTSSLLPLAVDASESVRQRYMLQLHPFPAVHHQSLSSASKYNTKNPASPDDKLLRVDSAATLSASLGFRERAERVQLEPPEERQLVSAATRSNRQRQCWDCQQWSALHTDGFTLTTNCVLISPMLHTFVNNHFACTWETTLRTVILCALVRLMLVHPTQLCRPCLNLQRIHELAGHRVAHDLVGHQNGSCAALCSSRSATDGFHVHSRTLVFGP